MYRRGRNLRRAGSLSPGSDQSHHQCPSLHSSGGNITVALVRQNGESKVSVADTGCGISSQHIPHVFNRFFRGDAPRNSHGTGLGLAIVKSIMQIHEGDVSVESESDKGTVVTLAFPTQKPTEPSREKRTGMKRRTSAK